MDFDEYEYLEKTVETAATAGASKECNGDGSNKVEEATDLSRSSKDKRDEDGHRSEHKKRPRAEDDEKDRDKSRHRDKDREHRSSRYDKDRERHDRKSRDVDDKDRDRDRRRDKEYKEKSKEREGSKDVVRGGDREFRRSRERRDKKDDPALPEVEPDPERDQRTVFAWQICLKAKEKDVYDFFSKAGKVRDVRLIMDRNSRRSKGVGYVEFYDVMSVPIAIAMSGQKLLGQPVMVKPSEAEKNQQHIANSAAAAGGFNGPYSGGARRLYVGNLHVNITEEQLRQVFEPFGIIELVQLPVDTETGLCKGYGFVQYQKLEDARCAQIGLNGVLELAGRPIKVSAVSDQQTGQELGITQGDLDDDEGGGLALNARSRALLMQKLDRSGTAASAMLAPPVPPVAQPMGVLSVANQMYGLGVSTEEPVGTPSECLLLKNMFDPTTETDTGFDLDIRDDVHEECSKHGHVKHIFVDKNSLGHVYVRFSSTQAAASAQQVLHKRWFAGKVIVATFMTTQTYESKFPESRRG